MLQMADLNSAATVKGVNGKMNYLVGEKRFKDTLYIRTPSAHLSS